MRVGIVAPDVQHDLLPGDIFVRIGRAERHTDAERRDRRARAAAAAARDDVDKSAKSARVDHG